MNASVRHRTPWKWRWLNPPKRSKHFFLWWLATWCVLFLLWHGQAVVGDEATPQPDEAPADSPTGPSLGGWISFFTGRQAAETDPNDASSGESEALADEVASSVDNTVSLESKQDESPVEDHPVQDMENRGVSGENQDQTVEDQASSREDASEEEQMLEEADPVSLEEASEHVHPPHDDASEEPAGQKDQPIDEEGEEKESPRDDAQAAAGPAKQQDQPGEEKITEQETLPHDDDAQIAREPDDQQDLFVEFRPNSHQPVDHREEDQVAEVPLATTSTEASTASHDKVQSIHELLDHDQDSANAKGIDARLASTLLKCRARGFGMVHAPVDPQQQSLAEYCNRVRYVLHLRERFATLQSSRLDPTARSATKIRIDMVDVAAGYGNGNDTNGLFDSETEGSHRSSGLDLEAFFVNYARTNRPVWFDHESFSLGGFEHDPERLNSFVASCFGVDESAGSGQFQLNLAFPSCVSPWLNESFHVPLYMVHDYLQRTTVSSKLTPTLIRLDRFDSPDKVISCPYSLHMLLVPLRGLVQVALTSRNDLLVDAGGIQANAIEFELLSDASHVSSRFSRLLEESDALLPQGAASRLELQTEPIQLEALTMLFVPTQFAAVVNLQSGASTGGRGEPPRGDLLRFCYVDASNLNAVKKELTLEGLVDPTARELLMALQAPAFDASMFRRTTLADTLYANFMTWPKPDSYNKRQASENNLASGSSDQQQPLSRRERFKVWQDDRRFDRLVESLTLPVSRPPVIVNASRSAVVLKWQDLYQSAKNDITQYGYEIRWQREDLSSATTTEHLQVAADGSMNVTQDQLIRSAMPTDLFGDEFDGHDIEATVTGLQADTVYSFTVRIFVGEAFGLDSDRSQTIRTLPCTPPGVVRGMPMVEAIDATSVQVRWIAPEDDGGQTIDYYLIGRRELSNTTDNALRLEAETLTEEEFAQQEHVVVVKALTVAPSDSDRLLYPAEELVWRQARVFNLFPDKCFLFRVAGINSVGIGKWSSKSQIIQTTVQHSEDGEESLGGISGFATSSGTRKSRVPVLRGIGDEKYTLSYDVSHLVHGSGATSSSVGAPLTSQSLEKVLTRAFPTIKRAMQVILSDVDQTLTLAIPTLSTKTTSDDELQLASSFSVWTAHFSPKKFDVSAELVLAEPFDGSRPLENAEVVRDRIVLMARGSVPFVYKAHFAQLAGALGLVIGDINGLCNGKFDQLCVPGSDRSRGEGFGQFDRHEIWQQLRIPVVLLHQDATQFLIKQVNETEATIQSHSASSSSR